MRWRHELTSGRESGLHRCKASEQRSWREDDATSCPGTSFYRHKRQQVASSARDLRWPLLALLKDSCSGIQQNHCIGGLVVHLGFGSRRWLAGDAFRRPIRSVLGYPSASPKIKFPHDGSVVGWGASSGPVVSAISVRYGRPQPFVE